VALDKIALDTPNSPEWWMQTLARRLLSRDRLQRFGILDAYRAGCPPMVTATDSQRSTFHAFNKVSRSNFARAVVRAPAERMSVRSIRTAAANDDRGDEVAWHYWTGCGLDTASTDVNSDTLTFSEGYVRVGVNSAGRPVALRRDPRFMITAQDPIDPSETIAAFELLWDEWTGTEYAYLDLPGEQWVATRKRANRPPQFSIPGLNAADRRWAGMSWFPRLSFDPAGFTMRPLIDDVPEAERDGGPYSQKFSSNRVAVVRFENRDGVGEFEEHLDLLDRLAFMTMLLMVTMGVQAYKQRSLEQTAGSDGTDRLPETNPETGERINWDEVFQPGPDALWKLPPGVTLKESGEVQLQPLLSAIQDGLKHLSVTTATPFSLFSPDGVNQSAEGAQAGREPLVFKVEDRNKLAGRSWAKVISLLFEFAPDADRYDADGNDRADQGKIVIDFTPAERFSLAEKAQADSQNKTLSSDMAAVKIWGLTSDEVALNRVQRTQDAMNQALGQAQAAAQVTGRGAGG
jgi:hypothetical protein